MTPAELSDLEHVTEAGFQKEYNILRPLIEAEARVQTQLARLDAQARQCRRESALTDGYRITGTDVLWQGWESSTRRQLNTELTRLRAQKLTALDALRAAFGRKQAVANLAAAREADRRRAQSKKSW